MTFKKSYGIDYYIDNGLYAAVLLMADDELLDIWSLLNIVLS